MSGVALGFGIWYGDQSRHPICRILMWEHCVWAGGMVVTDAGPYFYECGLVPVRLVSLDIVITKVKFMIGCVLVVSVIGMVLIYN